MGRFFEVTQILGSDRLRETYEEIVQTYGRVVISLGAMDAQRVQAVSDWCVEQIMPMMPERCCQEQLRDAYVSVVRWFETSENPRRDDGSSPKVAHSMI